MENINTINNGSRYNPQTWSDAPRS